MKIKSTLFISIIFIIFGQSCSNDFELIDTWKDIPVVYGLISLQDSVHYVRIEKAFVDPEIGADKLARIPDSLYYEDIQVVFVHNSKEYELEKIDGESIGMPKQEGFFAHQPNFLYKINASEIPLAGNDELSLVVRDIKGDSILTEATTNIVGNYDFAVNYPNDPIHFTDKGKTSISWRALDNEQSARFYDSKFIIRISEQKEPGSNEYVDKELVWVIEKRLERKLLNGNPASTTFRRIDANAFFNFLKNNLDGSKQIKRRFKNIDLIVNAGGESLYKYINIGLANTGITSAQTIPTYTNLSRGKGVFSSRNQVSMLEMGITTNTKILLMENEITKDLNFE